MEIYIIRHTLPDVPSGMCYGQTDIPLADSFSDELNTLKTKLPHHFDHVYTSPLKRCSTLAEEFSIKPIKRDELMELNFGSWEMKYWDDIGKENISQWAEDYINGNPPEGEKLKDMYNRATDLLEEIISENNNEVLIVTHSGIIRCLWAYINKMSLKELFSINVEFNEVYKITINNGDRTISKTN